MLIEGLQKLTLLDFPGHTACTVFTHGCNFRCPFCHNAPLVTHGPEGLIDEEEFFVFLEKRKNVLDGVAVTGGEPMLQKDLIPFLRRIKSLGYPIKIDTNGSFPDVLKQVVGEGLVDYVAMDIKNARGKYGVTIGLPDFNITPVEESVAFLLEGHVEYEFRTTVTADFHKPEDFNDIAEWIGKAKKYFLQNFVNSGDLIDPTVTGYSAEEMKRLEKCVKNKIPVAKLRGI